MAESESESDHGVSGRRSARRVRLIVLAVFAAGLLVGAAVGPAVGAYRQFVRPTHYWPQVAAFPVPVDAFRLVAFGDSAAMGMGADSPRESFVGRAAAYVQAVTHRPVHITNVASAGGTLADVAGTQLAAVGFSLAQADLVLVAAGDSDVLSARTPEIFEADLRRLADLLPADRTVISDLPTRPGYQSYQQILARVLDGRSVARARFADAFAAAGEVDIFALDGQHLNATGYRIWFEAFRGPIAHILATKPRKG